MKKIDGLDCILLVDDDKSNNYLHQMIIKKAGIDVSVQVVYNGLEALDYLTCTGKFSSGKKFPQPGIIFLDINMPLMNGWEFLEKYEKISEKQKNKIVMVMLTSSLNPDDIVKAESNSYLKGFISKPLMINNLNDVIQEYFLNRIDEGGL